MAKFCMAKNGPALYLDCRECTDKECESFFCLVVGSRTFSNFELMESALDHYLSQFSQIVIVSGGARGADSLAKAYAIRKGYRYKEFPAQWDLYGKSAGYVRNEEMHKYIAYATHRGVVAFWDGSSKGTAHNFKLAEKYNNPIRVVRYQ